MNTKIIRILVVVALLLFAFIAFIISTTNQPTINEENDYVEVIIGEQIIVDNQTMDEWQTDNPNRWVWDENTSSYIGVGTNDGEVLIVGD